MKTKKELEELIEAGLLTEEAAQDILAYYNAKNQPSSNRLLAIFGVIGATLIGMGVVLIVAHNWDSLSRPLKTVLAFLPLVISQLIVGFAFFKKPDRVAWKEGGSILLFFAIASCISLISQIYNISGELSDFILTWMLLSLPIVYVMRSSLVGIFYIIGISYFGIECGYFYPENYLQANLYWVLMLGVIPYYIYLLKWKEESNFLNFYNWLIPFSLTICLGLLVDSDQEWLLLIYMSFFGLLFSIGHVRFFRQSSLGMNGFKVIGSFGLTILLLITSFRAYWEEVGGNAFNLESSAFLVFILITLLASVLLIVRKVKGHEIDNKEWIFLLFIPIYFIGLQSSLVVVLLNLLILALGVYTIKDGVEKFHLGILNYGLLIIASLIACRFFDANLSFVVRGLIFVVVGIGFFLVNFWMIKKLKHADR